MSPQFKQAVEYVALFWCALYLMGFFLSSCAVMLNP